MRGMCELNPAEMVRVNGGQNGDDGAEIIFAPPATGEPNSNGAPFVGALGGFIPTFPEGGGLTPQAFIQLITSLLFLRSVLAGLAGRAGG